MPVLIVLALQSAPVAGPPSGGPRVVTAPCRPGTTGPDGAIVVCGRRGDSPYRLRPMEERVVDPLLPRAEMGIGDAKLGVEGEQGADARGGPINRAMVRLKIPF